MLRAESEKRSDGGWEYRDEGIIIIITESRSDRFESTAESTSSMAESMTERISMSAERRNRVWYVCDGW